MRTVISRAMTRREDGRKRSIMLADVKTAFLYGAARRSLYVELPPEDPLAASGRYVGKLERAMYGTRDAPMIWQDHLRKTLIDKKFKESVAHPGVFQHETRDLFMCVHVDDLLCTGVRDDLMWLKFQLSKEYELETKMMGDDEDMAKTAVYLGRHLNGERMVWVCGPIVDMCAPCCESWEWKRVEVCLRHGVSRWKRKEIGVTARR